jgi:hypothetical protein
MRGVEVILGIIFCVLSTFLWVAVFVEGGGIPIIALAVIFTVLGFLAMRPKKATCSKCRSKIDPKAEICPFCRTQF